MIDNLFISLYSSQRLHVIDKHSASLKSLSQYLLRYKQMVRLSLKFFRFIILFNLFVTASILWQSQGFMLRSIDTVLFYMFIFWLKIFGTILSVIVEYIFHLSKKKLFLKNLHISPIWMLIRLTGTDLLLFIILCLILKCFMIAIYT